MFIPKMAASPFSEIVKFICTNVLAPDKGREYTIMAVCAHAGEGSSQTGLRKAEQAEFPAGHVIKESGKAKEQ